MHDELGLPEALERAASALEGDSDAIRPANGDPLQLIAFLDDAAAARVLRWLLCNEPAAGSELALVWAEEGPRGLEALQGLNAADLPKAAAKTVRRLHHQLRSRGVQIPENTSQPVVARLAPVNDGIEEARVSLPDPSGTRLLLLALGHPAGGVRLFQVQVDEDLGLRGFDVFEAARRDVRRLLREFGHAEKVRAVPVPPDSWRAALARVVAEQPPDQTLPRGFAEWSSLLTEVPADTPTPAELAVREIPWSEDERSGLRARAVEQIEAGVLGPWISRLDELEATARQLEEAASGVVVVSGATRQAHLSGLLDDALDRLYDSASGLRAARRYEEAAYVLWKSGQEQDARACLCAARDFRELPPRENQVARAGIQRILGPFIEKLVGQEGEAGATPESSLLVKP